MNAHFFSKSECLAAVKSQGLEVESDEELYGMSQPCGCHYNPETKHVSFNRYQHHCFCFGHGCDAYEQDPTESMDMQDSLARHSQPVCARHLGKRIPREAFHDFILRYSFQQMRSL